MKIQSLMLFGLLTGALVLSSQAQAQMYGRTFCKDYMRKGTVNVTKFCADKIRDGAYRNPRMVDDNGTSWSVSPGVNPENRANRLCRILEGTFSHVSFRTVNDADSGSLLNLSGFYAFRWKLPDTERFVELVCH